METQVENTQAGAVANVPAADGGSNGSQEVANLKDILGPIFGTEFKTDEDALKSVENAKNMSGKVGQLETQLNSLRGQAPTTEITSKISELEAKLNQTQFYADNPQFNTPEAKQLIAAMGGEPSKVINTDAFKLAFDAIKVRNEVEQSKSVLHSNPRLGAATDKMTEALNARNAAIDAASKGDTISAQRAQSQAAANAVSAVLEAFEK